MRNIIIFAAAMVLGAGVSFAEDVTFTNAGGDGDWNNPMNWSGFSVPAPGDDVTIPTGLVCVFPGELPGEERSVQLNSLTNNGTLEFPPGQSVINANEDITNNGSIINGIGDLLLGSNTGDINNTGTIEAKHLSIHGNAVANYASGTIEGTGTAGVNICANEIGNDGTINGGSLTGGDGGGVQLYAYVLNNWSIISGGSGCTDHKGGSVEIHVRNQFNNCGHIWAGSGDTGQDGGSVKIHVNNQMSNTGAIEGGNGGIGGQGGPVYFNGKIISNSEGKLSGGYSDGGWRSSMDDPVAADLFIIADSIDINPGDSVLNAGTFHIRGRKLVFQNINTGLIADIAIEIYTTAGGTADFSGTHNSCAIFSMGGIDIYSDDVVAPAEGMDHICCPAPTTHSSDASIVDGDISAGSVIEYAGNSGNIKAFIQNLSTSAKVMHYDISSSKGWLTPTSGSTPSHAPFEFDSVLASFTIPASTSDSINDTVTAILSIAPSFTETTTCIIHSMGDSATVNISENNSLPLSLTVQAYPNPFNSSVAIAVPTNAGIEIYDLRGKRIDDFRLTIDDSQHPEPITANREFIWQPDETSASGIYLVKARTADGGTAVRRVVFLK